MTRQGTLQPATPLKPGLPQRVRAYTSRPGWRRLASGLFFFAFAIAFYQVVWDERPVPIDAWVDDWHYVKDALSIARLEWLGPYDEVTLIKRPLFSLLLAVPYVLHIQYTVFLFSMLFLGSAYIAIAMGRVGIPVWLRYPFFVCLLFLPTSMDREAMRVVRDPLFICVQLFMIGLIIHLFGTPRTTHNRRFRRFLFLALFLLLALHAGMREEAAVIYPGFLLMLVLFAAGQEGTRRARLLYGLKLFLAGTIAIQGSLLAIRIMNYAYYGVFILHEHEEGPFPAAMGAIASVRKPESTARTLISANERRQLNGLSPRFRAISGVLDSQGEATPPDCTVFTECDNHPYSHSIFFVRIFGFQDPEVPNDAREAAQFYRDLRAEIAALCDSGQIPCESPLRRSMMPPLRRFNLPYLYEAIRIHTRHILNFDNRGFSAFSHSVDPQALDDFRQLTRQRYYMVDEKTNAISGSPPAPLEKLARQAFRRLSIASYYSAYGPYIVSAALLIFLLRVVLVPFAGISKPLAVAAGMLLVILGRLAAVSYISAVDYLMVPNYSVPSYSVAIVFSFLSFATVPELLRGVGTIPKRMVSG
jgi:hypothetical protein